MEVTTYDGSWALGCQVVNAVVAWLPGAPTTLALYIYPASLQELFWFFLSFFLPYLVIFENRVYQPVPPCLART